MENKTIFFEGINKVERLATTTKLGRLLNDPIKYVSTMFFNNITYPLTKKEKSICSPLFFNEKMHLYLPASTDIYLTSGKSHSSEIRLAKFMINTICEGHCVFDVGAHYGYFTLLASALCKQKGQVHAFEAATPSFEKLILNTKDRSHIVANNMAVSDQKGSLEFHVFPNKYSEYNSFDIDQFKSDSWFKKYPPIIHQVQCVSLDEYIFNKNLKPDIFKIDVEGAEYNVIKGLKNYLNTNNPIVIMEYLADKRNNSNHKQACSLLYSLKYKSYIILAKGDVIVTQNVDEYFQSKKIDSDNIVFMK